MKDGAQAVCAHPSLARVGLSRAESGFAGLGPGGRRSLARRVDAQ